MLALDRTEVSPRTTEPRAFADLLRRHGSGDFDLGIPLGAGAIAFRDSQLRTGVESIVNGFSAAPHAKTGNSPGEWPAARAG
jgi:hypothetical protein